MLEGVEQLLDVSEQRVAAVVFLSYTTFAYSDFVVPCTEVTNGAVRVAGTFSVPG